MRGHCSLVIVMVLFGGALAKITRHSDLDNLDDQALYENDEPVGNSPRGPASIFASLWGYIEAGMASLGVLLGLNSIDRRRDRRVSYRGHQLFRVIARSKHSDKLKRMQTELGEGLQVWTTVARNRSTDILVPPNLVYSVKQFLQEHDMEFAVLSSDIQKSIAYQNPRVTKEQRKDWMLERGHSFSWRRYHRYEDIVSYTDYLTSTYPHLVELLTIGKSSEGLPLRVVRVSTLEELPDPVNLASLDNLIETDPDRIALQAPDPRPEPKRRRPRPRPSPKLHQRSQPRNRTARRVAKKKKPAVWIDGGTHAREWISPAVALYLLKQLVENYDKNRRLVQAADWYILPVLNPDGYEYTHTVDRLWRKTRSSHEEGRFFFSSPCEGVDLNRNWAYHWGERGSSDDPCHETYAGPRAFSEPESRAAAEFIMEQRNDIKLFLTLHSYSQMWLLPWGYTTKKVADYEDLLSKAHLATSALRSVYGTHYDVGTSPSLLYATSGGSDDWAKGVAGIKYAYTVELRDKGAFGFLLPASYILPTAKEMFAAIRALADAIVCRP